ncbi:MAG: energy-coupling factor transport system permease protein [Clostridiales bacterium]|nr:energy-coupling factor transport system permease protein [Clostridiales bacterium]MDK2933441.1 energy-coupling factor transport system permease protein [Clostridiales bacterium]
MIKMHPLITIFFSLTLFFMILTYNHPLYIISILFFIVVCLILLDKKKELIQVAKYSIYNMVLILIINSLISQSGRTIIYKSARIPIAGKIKITVEALAFGANMGLKLVGIVLIFLLYGAMTDRDDTFSLFSKYAHKFTLILSMTTNIIHRLKLEICRVKDVMVLRGVDFHQKNLVKRVKAYYPILKVILISSLEGSLERAEALYSRGYGKGKRTSYAQRQVKVADYIVGAVNLILLFLFGYGLFFNIGSYNFYPVLKKFDDRDIIYLILIDFVFLIILLIMWGCRRWKFLECRI